jgi:type II secretory pathway component GspD/PulD (secretin)
MKTTIGFLASALLLACGTCGMLAQTATAAEKTSAPAAETAPKTYRLTYTITHLDGTRQLGVQHFALTITSDNRDARIKLGSRIPIATGAFSKDGAPSPGQVEYQYIDVGLNIDARVREFSTGLLVFSKVEQSSVADEPSSAGNPGPVIRQGTLENTALLTLGKPVMLGSLDVPGSSMHMDIEVVLELVK